MQGASGGFSASGGSSDEYPKAKSEEDRARSESPKKHGVLCKFKGFFSNKSDQSDKNFDRCDLGRGSTQSSPVHPASEKPPVSRQHSLPGTMSIPSSKKKSPVHLVSIKWPLPEVTVEETSSVSGNNLKSSDEHEDKSQQLRPKVTVSRNDSGYKSADPSPRSSVAGITLEQKHQRNAQTHL